MIWLRLVEACLEVPNYVDFLDILFCLILISIYYDVVALEVGFAVLVETCNCCMHIMVIVIKFFMDKH